MATRSLRNRNSSRFPSPAVNANVEPESTDRAPETESGNQDEEEDGVWREPPVRVLPPSYKDHKGLERLGVLELQQPLGVPPSQKLLQRLKLNFNRPSNRSTPLPDDEVMSPLLDNELAESGSPMDADAPPAETDNMIISSPPRGRPSNRDMAAMQAAYPIESTPSPVKSNFSGTPQQGGSVTKPTSIQEHLRQERVQSYVNRAVNEAQDRGDWGLVPGLEKIRRNANDKRDLWMVLEAVAHRTPTPEQLHIFKKFIKRGLKKYRRESAGSTGSRPFMGNESGFISGEHTFGGDNGSEFASPFRRRPASGHSQPGPPSSRRLRNGVVDSHSPSQKVRSKNSRRRRSRSNSTSSSLSSAKSISEEHAPGGLNEAGSGGDERGVGQDGRQADERPSTGPRLRLINKNSSITPFDANSSFDTISSKAISEKLKKTQQAREEADAEFAEIEKRRKRLIKDSFVDYNYIPRPEAQERHQLRHKRNRDESTAPVDSTDNPPPPPIIHPDPVRPKPGPTILRLERRTESSLLMNGGGGRKRDYDEFAATEDDSDALTQLSSSPAPPYDPPPPPPNAVASRSATPRTRRSATAPKGARKSARVMVSPNKPKNGGITAGFTRAGPPARIAEVGSGADSSPEDNDEHCASCGGEGTLLCCDGCTNSFHHACLEPPLNPDEEVDGEWFCPQCIARRRKNIEESKAFLGRALAALDHAIPRAFALPEYIREYFEGVRTGDEGEYTEFGQPRTHTVAPKMNRAGFIEEPNYKEPRDNKGNLNVCKGCGLGANGKDLVPCDYCDAKWHLDCLDPPLSIPPRRRIGDKPNASWRCPLHVEQDLSTFGKQTEAAPGDLGGESRRRKPKNPKCMDVEFPRGFRNNGVIEVDLEDDVAALREIDMDGHIFRLPEQAIKLDFIDRVKKSWYEDNTYPYTANGRRPPRFIERDYRPSKGVVLHEPAQTTITIKEPDFYKGSQALSIVETARANAALRRKTLPEQQAILQLATMAAAEGGTTYGDELSDLTNALIAEAPEQVEQMQMRDERTSLQRLQALVERRLRILDGREVPTRQYGAGKKMSRRESVPTNNMQSAGASTRGLRELQPVPHAPLQSPTHIQQNPFNSMDPTVATPNGQGQYPIAMYGAAPPPSQHGQQSYPFPSTAQPAPYLEWQGGKPPPLPANVSPWQPSAQSPVRSPYGGPNQHSFASNQPFSAASPPPGIGASIAQPKAATQANTTASAPSHSGLATIPVYGPAPPASNTVGAPMYRQISMASAASGASGSRRSSLATETNQNAISPNSTASPANGSMGVGMFGIEGPGSGAGLWYAPATPFATKQQELQAQQQGTSTTEDQALTTNLDPALFTSATQPSKDVQSGQSADEDVLMANTNGDTAVEVVEGSKEGDDDADDDGDGNHTGKNGANEDAGGAALAQCAGGNHPSGQNTKVVGEAVV